MLRENALKHGNYSQRVRRYVRRVSRVGENLAWMQGCNPTRHRRDVGALVGPPPQ